jgi:hypothetical protein
LQPCTNDIVEDWLTKVKKSKDLNSVSVSDEERTGYLPKLIEDLVAWQDAELQGSTPAMLVHDSRILQVTLFGRLQRNLSALDLCLVSPDVMTIADEVDSQLTQAIESFTNVAGTAPAA